MARPARVGLFGACATLQEMIGIGVHTILVCVEVCPPHGDAEGDSSYLTQSKPPSFSSSKYKNWAPCASAPNEVKSR